MSRPQALVIMDYQNIHLTAHEVWAPANTPKHETLIHPLHFANQAMRKRAAILGALTVRGTETVFPDAELGAVHVYRGRPS